MVQYITRLQGSACNTSGGGDDDDDDDDRRDENAEASGVFFLCSWPVRPLKEGPTPHTDAGLRSGIPSRKRRAASKTPPAPPRPLSHKLCRSLYPAFPSPFFLLVPAVHRLPPAALTFPFRIVPPFPAKSRPHSASAVAAPTTAIGRKARLLSNKWGSEMLPHRIQIPTSTWYELYRGTDHVPGWRTHRFIRQL